MRDLFGLDCSCPSFSDMDADRGLTIICALCRANCSVRYAQRSFKYDSCRCVSTWASPVTDVISCKHAYSIMVVITSTKKVMWHTALTYLFICWIISRITKEGKWQPGKAVGAIGAAELQLWIQICVVKLFSEPCHGQKSICSCGCALDAAKRGGKEGQGSLQYSLDPIAMWYGAPCHLHKNPSSKPAINP